MHTKTANLHKQVDQGWKKDCVEQKFHSNIKANQTWADHQCSLDDLQDHADSITYIFLNINRKSIENIQDKSQQSGKLGVSYCIERERNIV